jgi:hypothetical protein
VMHEILDRFTDAVWQIYQGDQPGCRRRDGRVERVDRRVAGRRVFGSIEVSE